jgi:hypothetical protein
LSFFEALSSLLPLQVLLPPIRPAAKASVLVVPAPVLIVNTTKLTQHLQLLHFWRPVGLSDASRCPLSRLTEATEGNPEKSEVRQHHIPVKKAAAQGALFARTELGGPLRGVGNPPQVAKCFRVGLLCLCRPLQRWLWLARVAVAHLPQAAPPPILAWFGVGCHPVSFVVPDLLCGGHVDVNAHQRACRGGTSGA